MFSKNFHEMFNEDDNFNIIFTFSRTNIRIWHQSINLAEKHLNPEILFPPKMKFI